MQEIIDERSVEIEKVRRKITRSNYSSITGLLQIHKGLVEVNNLFVDLSKLVKEQQVKYLLFIV